MQKKLRLRSDSVRLNQIFNYQKIDDQLSTSGQPSEGEFELIKGAGFQTVINLAPHDAENSLRDEAGLLRNLSLDCIHIPVDFFKPNETDFSTFRTVMDNHRAEKVWVHCAANMRVSAFLFRYRTEKIGVDRSLKKHELNRIWEPFDFWKPFMSDDLRNK